MSTRDQKIQASLGAWMTQMVLQFGEDVCQELTTQLLVRAARVAALTDSGFQSDVCFDLFEVEYQRIVKERGMEAKQMAELIREMHKDG